MSSRGRPADFPATAWSPSRFAVLRRCPREHDLKYRRKVRPAGGDVSTALAVGSYVHDVLEFVGRECLAGFDASEEIYDNASLLAQSYCSNPAALIDGARLIAAYRLRYGDELAGWNGYELVAVEQVMSARELHTTLGGFAAIADVVVKDDDGIWAVERKTAGRMQYSLESEVIKSVRTRPQFQALAYCGRDVYGSDFKGVIYDLLVKTKLVGFQRVKLPRDDEELDRFAAAQQSLEKIALCDHPNFDACDPPAGWRCDYFSWCHGTDKEREQLYQVRLSH